MDIPHMPLGGLVRELERLAKERIEEARTRKPDVADQLARYKVPLKIVRDEK